MECKLPLKEIKEVRTSRQNIRLPVLDDIPMDTPAYSHMSESWKAFGKWAVAIEESKNNNDVKVSRSGMKHNHVCVVLKSIGFTFYFYELIDDYTKKQLDAFRYIRLLLDRVLVANQVTSRKLRFYLERFEGWSGDVFPHFLKNFDDRKIAEWSDDIDAEIEKWSNTKFDFKKTKINRDQYWNKIAKPNNWDIKGCYGELLSILNTLKPELPQENIMIVDDLIARFEHGYHLGYITCRTIAEYQKKHPKFKNHAGSTRNRQYLLNRLQEFRKGREDRVLKATKAAFEWNKDVAKKLNRMFEFKKAVAR